MARVRLQNVASGASADVEVKVDARSGDGGDVPRLVRVRVGDREIALSCRRAGPESNGCGSGHVDIDGRRVRFEAVRRDDRVFVLLGDRAFEFDVVRDGPRRKGAAAADVTDSIVAPMPGTVLRVRVDAGESFEPGDPIIIIESMKMEMTLSAPHAGVVREILCKPGQLVEMGAVLATLDPTEPAT